MTAPALFADEMKAAREQRGWSQADLADKIPYSLSTISMMEALHRAPARGPGPMVSHRVAVGRVARIALPGPLGLVGR